MAPGILIAAGGTGGHIFPGLALAGAIKRLAPEARVSFMGTPRGLEGNVIPQAGYDLHLVGMLPFSRRIGFQPVLAMAALVRSAVQARAIVRAERPSVVVGMGGYVSLPALVAARVERVPSLIHESGAVAGLANKVAARFTSNIALAFEDAAAAFRPNARRRVVGTPVSEQIAHMERDDLREEARSAFGLPPDCFTLLVLGGSLGALRLNKVAVGLAARWKDREDVRILLKAGSDHLAATQTELEKAGASITHPVAFFERMDHAYAAADLALCRAGAGTVAELPVAHLPAILVPYPYAPNDHQTRNAEQLAGAGAAAIVTDSEATAERIGPLVEELLDDPDRIGAMAVASRKLARPHAADELAQWVLEVAGAGNG